MVKDSLSWLGALLVGAILVGGGAFLGSCRRAGDTSSEKSTPARSSSRGPRGQPEREASSSTVDLAELVTEVPEYKGQGRNLFDFGRDPRTTAPPRVTPRAPTTTAPTPIRPPPTPRPRVDLKFAGFVEKTEPEGESKKYAVLLNGEEILTGAVGDLVANRYRIIEIGLESVTVGVEGSPVTQKIPLRTN